MRGRSSPSPVVVSSPAALGMGPAFGPLRNGSTADYVVVKIVAPRGNFAFRGKGARLLGSVG